MTRNPPRCLMLPAESDWSHVVKTGDDVNYLFLEILPRLAPGTLVHVHDTNFPSDYLLQAFLSYNSEFKMFLCNSYLATHHRFLLRATFPPLQSLQGGSF